MSDTPSTFRLTLYWILKLETPANFNEGQLEVVLFEIGKLPRELQFFCAQCRWATGTWSSSRAPRRTGSWCGRSTWCRRRCWWRSATTPSTRASRWRSCCAGSSPWVRTNVLPAAEPARAAHAHCVLCCWHLALSATCACGIPMVCWHNIIAQSTWQACMAVHEPMSLNGSTPG